jgi:IPTL-CTERM motif
MRISYVSGTGDDVTLTTLGTSATAIPTLSEWGMLLLTGLLMAAGLRSIISRGARF